MVRAIDRGEVKELRIHFNVGATAFEFRRHWFTGRAELLIDGNTVVLQDPWNLGTHVSVTLKRSWRYQTGEHEVVIQKVRPLILAAFRPHAYNVLVDGQSVAERTGY